jgi:hypothetical protein
LATQDREPVQPSAPAPAGPRNQPNQSAQPPAGKLKTGIAGREPVNQSPANNLNKK